MNAKEIFEKLDSYTFEFNIPGMIVFIWGTMVLFTDLSVWYWEQTIFLRLLALAVLVYIIKSDAAIVKINPRGASP